MLVLRLGWGLDPDLDLFLGARGWAPTPTTFDFGEMIESFVTAFVALHDLSSRMNSRDSVTGTYNVLVSRKTLRLISWGWERVGGELRGSDHSSVH